MSLSFSGSVIGLYVQLPKLLREKLLRFSTVCAGPLRGVAATIRLSREKDWDCGLGGFDELPADLRKVRIMFRARDVSLTTFLKYVAGQAKLDLHTTSMGIVSRPRWA